MRHTIGDEIGATVVVAKFIRTLLWVIRLMVIAVTLWFCNLFLLSIGGTPLGGYPLKVEWLQRDSEIDVAKFVQPLGLRLNSSI